MDKPIAEWTAEELVREMQDGPCADDEILGRLRAYDAGKACAGKLVETNKTGRTIRPMALTDAALQILTAMQSAKDGG